MRLTAPTAMLAFALFGADARAQDLPGEVDFTVPGVEPAAPVEPDPLVPVVGRATTYRTAFAWHGVGPRGVRQMSDVAIDGLHHGVWAAVTLAGEVWVTRDQGQRWQPVLGTIAERLGEASGDERLLLDVETRLGEILDELSLDDDEAVFEDDAVEDLEAIEDATRQAAQEAVQALQVDAFGGSWFSELGREGAAGEGRPHVWFPIPGQLLAGRLDGLWWSEDLGSRWEQVLERPTRSVVFVPAEAMWLAATDDGVRVSDDLRRWSDPIDGSEGLRMQSLSVAPEGVYAATDDGVWLRGSDEGRWRPMGAERSPVVAVYADPLVAGGLWISDGGTVFQGSLRGEQRHAMLGTALAGVEDFAPDAGGLLLVAGEDGPWESRDGGTTFVPITRGLTELRTRGIEAVEETVLVVGDEGVFQLGGLRAPQEEAVRHDESWIPVARLLEAATRRSGIDRPVDRLGAKGQFLSYALPQLQVEVRHHQVHGRAALLDAGLTSSSPGDLSIWAHLVWRPAGFSQGGDPVDDLVVIPTAGAPASDVVADGRDQWMMLGRVGRRITDRHLKAAQQVSEMYYNRSWLIAERRRGNSGGSLLDSVQVELRIQELEAWMDVLTGGAVRRYRPQEEEAG